MSYPILKYLALETKPATAYALEHTELDIGRIEKVSIDKPTIYESLDLLEEAKQVRVTDPKVCRDGRVRKKYLVTRQGIAELLGFGEGYTRISKKDLRDLAERQTSSFPNAFSLWPEFIREDIDNLARRELMDVCLTATPDDVDRYFFGRIAENIRNVDESNHDRWLQATARNQTIAKNVLLASLRDLAESISRTNQVHAFLPKAVALGTGPESGGVVERLVDEVKPLLAFFNELVAKQKAAPIP